MSSTPAVSAALPRALVALSGMRARSLPLLAGLLLALAFPCHPENPFAILYHPFWAHVALLPLFVVLRGEGFKSGLRAGWLAGALFNLLSLYWVAHTQGGGPAVVAGTFLMAAYLGLFTGLFAGLLDLSLARWPGKGLLAAPLLWSAQEYLLSLGELGFPWLLLGHSQAPFTPAIQQAAWTGVYGVSAWVVLVNALLFLAATRQGQRPRLALLGGATLAFMAPWLHGLAVMGAPGEAAKSLRVGLVQPNLFLDAKWGPGGLERSFAALEQLSRRAVAHEPGLLVWPETALPCYLRQSPACQQQLTALVDQLQIPVLTGASDYEDGEPYNAAFLALPGQPQLTGYAKMHLVPFGERTPYRDSIPFLRDIDWTALTGDLGPAEFARGKKRTLFAHEQTPFAVLICFESVFPDLVRRHVQSGAGLLVNITNDSWFGRTAGPYQHAQINILRAVENRTSIARSATSGISLFIDPFGRTTGATSLFVAETIVGEMPLGYGETFYTRRGDLFARLGLAFALLVAVLPLFSRLRP